MLRVAVLQAVVLLAIAFVLGLGFNSFSRKGVNPFKAPARVPVTADSLSSETGGIRVIELEETKRFVAAGGSVLDARREEDYAAGHIPGALLFDYYDMGAYRDQVLPLLSTDQEIMIYCSEASCEDSELLAKELYALGYRRLLVFKGGFAEWSGAGLPAEKSAQ